MKRSKRSILVLLLVLSCLGCDQVSKVIAKSVLPKAGVVSFAGDTVRFHYAENKGAVLSFES